MFFEKTRDLRTEHKQAEKDAFPATLNEGSNLKKAGSVYWKLLLLPLLPVFLLFKILDYIHLLIFVIFGGLFLYLGLTKFFVNSWLETALLTTVGVALIVAPIMYIFDKDK